MGTVSDANDESEHAIVRCGTSAGDFTMQFNKEWSPHGYERAVALFQHRYYDFSHIFRVVTDFLVQFGISYTTSSSAIELADETIPDDPQLDPPIPFDEGIISFAGNDEDSRQSELFICYALNSDLGKEPWEVPVGLVIEGMGTVRSFYSGYGDVPPLGDGPEQNRIESGGRRYIEDNYPLLDRFLKCSIDIRMGGSDGRDLVTYRRAKLRGYNRSDSASLLDGALEKIGVSMIVLAAIFLAIIVLAVGGHRRGKKGGKKS